MIRQAASSTSSAVSRLRTAAVLQNNYFHFNNNKAAAAPLQQRMATRTLVDKAPGVDPLVLLRKDCLARKLCDEGGYRNAGVHWVFALAMSPPDNSTAPSLRTLGIQKVSPAGIDFVVKKRGFFGNSVADNNNDDSSDMERPVSILYSQGKYKPGNTAEQWRGDGMLEKIPLTDVLHCLPHYTVTGMLVSKRMEKERLEQESHDTNDKTSPVRVK